MGSGQGAKDNDKPYDYWWNEYEKENGNCYFCRRPGGRWLSCTCPNAYKARGSVPKDINLHPEALKKERAAQLDEKRIQDAAKSWSAEQVAPKDSCHFCSRPGLKTQDCTCLHAVVYREARANGAGAITAYHKAIGDVAVAQLQPTEGPGMVNPEPPKGKQPFNGIIDGGGFKRSMDPSTAKVDLGLIDPDFKEAMAQGLMKGAEKYAVGNWRRGMGWNETLNALERHLDKLRRGELIDQETGVPHAALIADNAMFFYVFSQGPRAAEYKQFDDRPSRDRSDF